VGTIQQIPPEGKTLCRQLSLKESSNWKYRKDHMVDANQLVFGVYELIMNDLDKTSWCISNVWAMDWPLGYWYTTMLSFSGKSWRLIRRISVNLV
jgi:hypothetical protein